MTATLDSLQASINGLWSKVKTIYVPPASVLTAISEGRKELGWESGYLSLADANSTASPILGITVNNDADFVGKRAYLFQCGPAGAGIPVPPSVTFQIRDSATGDTFLRTPGSPAAFLTQPYNPGSQLSTGRFLMADKGWPAPHILKKGSTAFFEINNPTGYVFVGDLYMVYEGYRLYAGESEPVPPTIKGQVEPFSWNGSLVVPGGLAAGQQILGVITMQGLDSNRYILKNASIVATGIPNPVVPAGATVPVQLFPEDVLLVQIQDTYQQNKFWGRVSSPPMAGQFFPAKALTVGGTGAPWAWPRFVQGSDTIFATIYGDPAAWAGSAPGTIELQLNGVRIYG